MIVKEKVDVVSEVKNRLGGVSKETGLTTSKVRSVSATVFKLIEDKSICKVFDLCEALLDEGSWELGVVAYDWAFRMKKQYNEETFYRFEKWLENYVTGWGDCDDFCTHAFGELLSQNNKLFKNIVEWTKHPSFWVRRAAAVILIYPIKKDGFKELDPFLIADRLMMDEHHLVQKGYGWMLKVLSTVLPDEVYEFLVKNKEAMPRVSFRYSLEKLDADRRIRLMQD